MVHELTGVAASLCRPAMSASHPTSVKRALPAGGASPCRRVPLAAVPAAASCPLPHCTRPGAAFAAQISCTFCPADVPAAVRRPELRAAGQGAARLGSRPVRCAAACTRISITNLRSGSGRRYSISVCSRWGPLQHLTLTSWTLYCSTGHVLQAAAPGRTFRSQTPSSATSLGATPEATHPSWCACLPARLPSRLAPASLSAQPGTSWILKRPYMQHAHPWDLQPAPAAVQYHPGRQACGVGSLCAAGKGALPRLLRRCHGRW